MNNERIVNSIKSLCKSHNITVTKLEEVLGLSQGLISRWNKSDPSLSKIIDIADYFNISIDEVVGHRNVLNDKFIEKLIISTDNGEIQWKNYNSKENVPKQYLEPCDIAFISQKDFEEYSNTHQEISYYSQINNSYISIYGSYEYNNIKDPKVIKLFIQPDKKSELIKQDYSSEQLVSLWLKILFALNEEAPAEIKAEEFKNSFILRDSELSSVNKITEINDLLKEPGLFDLLQTINSKEFKELQKTFMNPEFQAAIKVINTLQSHFNETSLQTSKKKED